MLFLIGLVVGGTLGMVIAALCTISAVEARMEEMVREYSEGDPK